MTDNDAFAIGKIVRQLSKVENWPEGDIGRAKALSFQLAVVGFKIVPKDPRRGR